jgi:hypothetical protein
MSGFVVVRDRYDGRAIRRASGWTRDYLRRAALADLGCAILGVFAAAQLRFCRNVTGTCIALSLAVRKRLRLTGLWRVTGRSGVSQEATRLDLSYAKNWSLARRPADFRRRHPHPHHESDTARLLA